MAKERMHLSHHQTCTCQCGFEQGFRQVPEMQHERVKYMKGNETKYNELVQIRLKFSWDINQSLI